MQISTDQFIILIFLVLIIILFVVDFLQNRNPHEIGIKEAIKKSLYWIIPAILFGIFIYILKDGILAQEYFTAYLVEKSLSVDNLFVFTIIFSSLSIEPKNQHKVLYLGILCAFIFRIIFIFAGNQALEHFAFLIYPLGIFLLYTGVKMLFEKEENNEEKKSFDKYFNFIDKVPFLEYDESDKSGKLFFLRNKKLIFTILGIALLIIEFTDIAFAFDSVPTVLSITPNLFIAIVSNIFAILGLRSLYFLVYDLLKLLKYLKYGLAIILIFIGLKIVLPIIGIHIDNGISMIVVISILIITTILPFVLKLFNKNEKVIN